MKKAQFFLFATTLTAFSVYEIRRENLQEEAHRPKVTKLKSEKKVVKTIKKHSKKS